MRVFRLSEIPTATEGTSANNWRTNSTHYQLAWNLEHVFRGGGYAVDAGANRLSEGVGDYSDCDSARAYR